MFFLNKNILKTSIDFSIYYYLRNKTMDIQNTSIPSNNYISTKPKKFCKACRIHNKNVHYYNNHKNKCEFINCDCVKCSDLKKLRKLCRKSYISNEENEMIKRDFLELQRKQLEEIKISNQSLAGKELSNLNKNNDTFEELKGLIKDLLEITKSHYNLSLNNVQFKNLEVFELQNSVNQVKSNVEDSSNVQYQVLIGENDTYEENHENFYSLFQSFNQHQNYSF